MSDDVKIGFSQQELTFMKDAEFLLTKRVITKKVYDLFYEFSREIKNLEAHQNFIFPPGTDNTTGKISRGENYKGLPYIILDFPRLIEKGNILALRTIFWWGNYFNLTLHVKGKALQTFRPALLKNWTKLPKSKLYLCTGSHEWNHDLTSDDYSLLKDLSEETVTSVLKEKPFVKLGWKMPLEHYDLLLKDGIQTYKSYLQLLR